MYWEKEIRFKLTTRRIFGGIVAAMSVLNLAVVGAVFNDSYQSVDTTASPTSVQSRETFAGFIPTNTQNLFAPVLEFTTSTAITSSLALTYTSTPIDTATTVPTTRACIKRSDWSIYQVRAGDVLIAIAQVTGTTVPELMLANCLPDTRIYAGQLLYVPRLPTYTLTFTSSATPSVTPTATSTHTPTATVTDTPTATPATFATTCDKAYFIADVTIPAGTVMLPGEKFTKVWRLKNIGSCTWTTSYRLVFYGGDPMGVPSSNNLPTNVAPGQSVDISLDMTSPLINGSYKGYWIFRNTSGALFGIGSQANEPWPVMINVSGPTVIPDEPTVFQNPSGSVSLCYYPYVIDFSILPMDPQGIKSVVVVYNINDGVWNEMYMTLDGSTYYASVSITDQISTAYYRFSVIDGNGNSKDSDLYKVTFLTTCPQG